MANKPYCVKTSVTSNNQHDVSRTTLNVIENVNVVTSNDGKDVNTTTLNVKENVNEVTSNDRDDVIKTGSDYKDDVTKTTSDDTNDGSKTASNDAVDDMTFQTSDKSFRQVTKSDISTNCPSDGGSIYETTYPVFSAQTEYGQEGVHVEPFYRYRVYSESKV